MKITDQSTGPLICCSGKILNEIGTDVEVGCIFRPSSSTGITGTIAIVSGVRFTSGAAKKTHEQS